MYRFEVWAPAADTVELTLPVRGHRLAMTRGASGWWWAEVPEAGHGTDYAFHLDGGPPRPDPRSAWQPLGVHGPSRLFDPALHRWRDTAWTGRPAVGSVIYELHVGTFTAAGTLDAAIERLDHLVELGVELVELMPVCAMPGRHGWGYDGVAPYSVHEPYGGPAALQRFVDACHGRGLGVCLDVVHNHLGPEGNYLAEFGPYFTDRHRTPWGSAVNLDGESHGPQDASHGPDGAGCHPVRRYLIDSALRWFTDFHLDALRLDAVHQLHDHSERHLLAQLSDETAKLADRLGRPLSLIAESDLNDPRMIEPTRAAGFGMDAQWADDIHHAVHAWLTGERQGYYADFGSTATLAHALQRVFVHEGGWSSFRGRPWGTPVDVDRHEGHRFVAFTQSHDQIGNRAGGERLCALVSDARAAAAAALVLTSATTPMLFMGEEWAASTPWPFFCEYGDPALGEAVRAGRLAEFGRHGWDPELIADPNDPATRDRAVLRWDERTQPRHARMLRWYRDLLAWRRTEKDLRDGSLAEVAAQPVNGGILIRRGELLIAIAAEAEAGGPMVVPQARELLLAWGPVHQDDDGLRLKPESVALARR